jgi:hypothetical protein
MPVYKKTISESIKDSKKKPGQRCEHQSNKVPFPPGGLHPSEEIKQDQADVENKKEYIKNLVQHHLFDTI